MEVLLRGGCDAAASVMWYVMCVCDACMMRV